MLSFLIEEHYWESQRFVFKMSARGVVCTVPKNNYKLRRKTEPITAGADATAKCPAFVSIYLAQKPEKYRCIWSSRDWLGFNAKIQIIFGTVKDSSPWKNFYSAAIFLFSYFHMLCVSSWLLFIMWFAALYTETCRPPHVARVVHMLKVLFSIFQCSIQNFL